MLVSSPRHTDSRLVEITLLSCCFSTVSITSKRECSNFTIQFHKHYDTGIEIRLLKFICGNASQGGNACHTHAYVSQDETSLNESTSFMELRTLPYLLITP